MSSPLPVATLERTRQDLRRGGAVIAKPKVPEPRNDQAERAIISHILFYEDGIRSCLGMELEAEHFYLPSHKVIYEAACWLLSEGRPVTYTAVC